MNEPQFPESGDEVQSTLARVLELKGLAADAQLVRMAAASVQYSDHDNWNGGTEFFTLVLRIPLEVFVQVESTIDEREKALAGICNSIWRDHESFVLGTVRIIPDRATAGTTAVDAAAHRTLPQFWDHGRFRLFLSHCYSQRQHVGLLKQELQTYGITAFVAHDDIEPSAVWQLEIEKALRTCEALCAIVSVDFANSLWCDQEVGWALGRGMLILPVRFGAQPHGFIGKIQSLPVPQGEQLSKLAATIASMLLRAPQTAVSMTNALVDALANARSFAQAKGAAAKLETVPSVSVEHARALRRSLKENDQVYKAIGVPDRIARILSTQQG